MRGVTQEHNFSYRIDHAPPGSNRHVSALVLDFENGMQRQLKRPGFV